MERIIFDPDDLTNGMADFQELLGKRAGGKGAGRINDSVGFERNEIFGIGPGGNSVRHWLDFMGPELRGDKPLQLESGLEVLEQTGNVGAEKRAEVCRWLVKTLPENPEKTYQGLVVENASHEPGVSDGDNGVKIVPGWTVFAKKEFGTTTGSNEENPYYGMTLDQAAAKSRKMASAVLGARPKADFLSSRFGRPDDIINIISAGLLNAAALRVAE